MPGFNLSPAFLAQRSLPSSSHPPAPPADHGNLASDLHHEFTKRGLGYAARVRLGLSHPFINDLTSPSAIGLGTCVPRGCRRDEFPYGYPSNATQGDLPVMCGEGEYCLDYGSACRGTVGVGEACEMNRDGESREGRFATALKLELILTWSAPAFSHR